MAQSTPPAHHVPSPSALATLAHPSVHRACLVAQREVSCRAAVNAQVGVSDHGGRCAAQRSYGPVLVARGEDSTQRARSAAGTESHRRGPRAQTTVRPCARDGAPASPGRGSTSLGAPRGSGARQAGGPCAPPHRSDETCAVAMTVADRLQSGARRLSLRRRRMTAARLRLRSLDFGNCGSREVSGEVVAFFECEAAVVDDGTR
jgi:hypothetical protein